MFTVLSNTRNSNMYIVLALAITLVVLLTFAVAPSIAAPKPAFIPVTGNQNAYVEFLRGEKAMYANPIRLSESLSAYHAGEKAVYANAVDSSRALSTYRLGEQAIYPNSADLGNALSTWRSSEKAMSANSPRLSEALSTYQLGEKTIYTNTVDSAVSAWHFGEKAIVQSDAVESALSAWRQGEKHAK